MLWLVLVFLALFLAAVLVAKLCTEELKAAEQPAAFLLCAALLLSLGLASYGLVPWWLHALALGLVLLGCIVLPILSLYRWLLWPLLFIAVARGLELWSLSFLLLATLFAATLIAKAREPWLQTLGNSVRFMGLPLLLTTVVFFFL